MSYPANTQSQPVDTATESTVDPTFTYTYKFKSTKADKLQELLENADSLDTRELINKHFEIWEVDESTREPLKYMRKPVEVTLHTPDWILGLDPLARSVIQEYIASWVRGAYIEQFQPVGPHDWDTISADVAEKARSSSTGSRATTPSDTVLQLAAAHFGRFVAEQTNNTEIGERLEGVILGKCTQASITKHLQECSTEFVGRIQARLDTWIEYCDNTGDEHLEDLLAAYSYCSTRLAKVRAALDVNIHDVIKNQL